MRLYCNLSKVSSETLTNIRSFFFDICNKINIYFPNEATSEVIAFEQSFLSATHIIPDGINAPVKEGFDMVIASLSDEVKSLIKNLDPSLHLCFGLIKDDTVSFYVDTDDTCVIETDDETLCDNPLFKDFKQI